MHRQGRLALLVAFALLAAPPVVSAQERRVTGLITRQDTGTPLEGAEVSVVGPTRGPAARSGTDGRYSLVAEPGELRLQVRAIGFRRVEFTLPAGQNTADFRLAQDVFNLSEVVVSGQATTIERRSATTAVSLVTGDELQKVPVPTVEAALTGKITGVNLQSNSGAPGGGIQMQIRGNNTILGGYDPLFVVDGVIYSNASIPSGRGYANAAASVTQEADAVNRLADLNPNDIASIEVLKGASASSIYGSKAANGVVVITTTRGASGTPRFNMTQRFGVFSPLRLMDSRRWSLDYGAREYGEAARPFFEGKLVGVSRQRRGHLRQSRPLVRDRRQRERRDRGDALLRLRRLEARRGDRACDRRDKAGIAGQRRPDARLHRRSAHLQRLRPQPERPRVEQQLQQLRLPRLRAVVHPELRRHHQAQCRRDLSRPDGRRAVQSHPAHRARE